MLTFVCLLRKNKVDIKSALTLIKIKEWIQQQSAVFVNNFKHVLFRFK